MKLTPQYPIEIAEPVENSQLPDTLMLPLRNPDIEPVDPQVTFTTTSIPVLVIEPPIVSAPLIVALPEAVSNALFEEVALMFNEAPELMVRFLHTGVLVPLIRGWFAGADGMITSSVDAGAPAGDQFVDVFQAVLVVPVHVFWAKMLVENVISNADTNNVIFLIGV
jgi:hypothetical protein